MIQDGKLRGFAMGQAIPVRTDYTAGEVRCFAQRAKDAAQARRLLAIAAVLDGASREEAATIGAGRPAPAFMATADATGRTKREKIIKANPLLERFTVADL